MPRRKRAPACRPLEQGAAGRSRTVRRRLGTGLPACQHHRQLTRLLPAQGTGVSRGGGSQPKRRFLLRLDPVPRDATPQLEWFGVEPGQQDRAPTARRATCMLPRRATNSRARARGEELSPGRQAATPTHAFVTQGPWRMPPESPAAAGKGSLLPPSPLQTRLGCPAFSPPPPPHAARANCLDTVGSAPTASPVRGSISHCA